MVAQFIFNPVSVARQYRKSPIHPFIVLPSALHVVVRDAFSTIIEINNTSRAIITNRQTNQSKASSYTVRTHSPEQENPNIPTNPLRSL